MIIIDTNVASEPLRKQGNPLVLEWLDNQKAETFYITSTTLAELLVGVEIMPDGKRKIEIATGLNTLIAKYFGSRILPFDSEAAKIYALLVARSRLNGISISFADGQIAAIALVYGFKVATRDVLPFEAAGLDVINPWQG